MTKFEISREKLRTSEFKDIKSEKILLAGTLKHLEIIRKCSREFSSEIFSSDRCKLLYECIVDFYNKENQVLDNKAFEIYMESKPKEERITYKNLWKNVIKLKKTVKVSACLAIVDKLNALYTARMLQFGISKTVESLKKAVDGGYSIIDEAKQNFLAVSPFLEQKKIVCTITDPLSLYEDFKHNHIKIQKDPSLLRAVPTGLAPLDEIMGGLRPSEFGLITAATGVGKSILLNDFAFYCFKTSGDTLYVTIEMPENQLRERFYCRMSGIEYSKFRKYKLSEKDWKIMDKKIEKLKGNDYQFRILDMPKSCSVQSLRVEIEEFIRKTKIQPKLIIIDYMNILQGGFDWTKQLEIAVDIKQQIARYFKIATWSASQLMGSKRDKEQVRSTDMAFAKNIVDNVDIGIGIAEIDPGGQEPEDENEEKVMKDEEREFFNVSFTKTRDFKGKSFVIEGDRSRMTFCAVKRQSEEKISKKKELGGDVNI